MVLEWIPAVRLIEYSVKVICDHFTEHVGTCCTKNYLWYPDILIELPLQLTGVGVQFT